MTFDNTGRKPYSPVEGALLRAALVANCLRGALPPVDLRAVCLVRAIFEKYCSSFPFRRVVCLQNFPGIFEEFLEF